MSPQGLLDDLRTALAFLTRLPVSAPEGRTLSEAVRAFPVVGLIVGAIAGAFVYVGSYGGLHPLACAFLGLGVGMALSGGLHEDGLADVADGFGGGHSRERKLEILRDSRIGTYGVLALIVVIGVKAGALAGVPGPGLAALTLVAAHVLGRAAVPLVMVMMEPARTDGLGATAGRPEPGEVIVSVSVGVLLCALLIDVQATLVAVVLGVGAISALVLLAKNQIGGYTGDVLGTAEQLVEAAVIIAAATTLDWM